MIFFPEIRLKRVCDQLLSWMKKDLKDNLEKDTENLAWLYLCFHEDTTDQHESSLYKQAKEIFLRKEDNPKYLEVYPIFDPRRKNLPTIFVTIPQDNQDLLQLGDIEGKEYYNSGTVSPRYKLERGFKSNFGLITSSDNIQETLIISYVLRALFMGSIAQLQSIGFINPSFSVQNIEAQENILPQNMYMKGLLMTCDYVDVVPEVKTEIEANLLIFNISEIKY